MNGIGSKTDKLDAPAPGPSAAHGLGKVQAPSAGSTTKVRPPAPSPSIEIEAGPDPHHGGRFHVVATLRGAPGVSLAGKVNFVLDSGKNQSAPLSDGQAELSGLELEPGKHGIDATFVPAVAGDEAAGSGTSASVEYKVP